MSVTSNIDLLLVDSTIQFQQLLARRPKEIAREEIERPHKKIALKQVHRHLAIV